MQIAFETVIWGRQLEDVELVLDTIAACGYQGVEFAQSPDEIYVRDPSSLDGRRPLQGIQELLSLLAQRQLCLVGFTGGTLTRRMTFCGDYRPEFLTVDNWREDDEEARNALSAQPPFKLALHPHWFKKVRRISQVKDILQSYRQQHPTGDHLCFLADTAHLFLAGDDPAEVVAEMATEIDAIHLKDWAPTYGRYSQRYAHGFVALGRGVVQLDRILEVIKNKEFGGWVIVARDFAGGSGLNVAATCAGWLIARGLMLKSDPKLSNIDDVHRREKASQKQTPLNDSAVQEMMFLDRAFKATDLGPKGFYQAISDALFELGGLATVKLYSFNPTSEELYLLGVSGKQPQPSPSVITVGSGLWRHAINEQRIYNFDLRKPEIARIVDGAESFVALNITHMITVPIFSRSNPHQLRFLISFFPSDLGFLGLKPNGNDILNRLAAHVSRLADNVIDDACSAAAMETNYACGHSKTRSEFLAKFVSLIQRQFDCEGASVFLVNETGDRLELKENATLGVEWSPTLKPEQRYYKIGEGLTGHVWRSGEMFLLSDANKELHSNRRSWELRESGDREEYLIFPMAKLLGSAIGVVRLINKRKPSGALITTMFTDDDAAILDSIVQTAIPYLEILALQERQLNTLTRMTHEFQVPMVAIRGAVDLMQRALMEQNSTAKELFGEDYLGDVLNWSGLLGQLAGNAQVFATAPGALIVRRLQTNLMSEVVAPAVRQVHLLLQERSFKADCIGYESFCDIPPLWIDRHQFQQVVFNLLSNAIKYAERDSLSVQISARHSGSWFIICFQDWGMGIEEGLADSIFLPGFRSRKAMQRDVAGQGIGLYVVRAIVEAHNGQVVLANSRQPTMFEISLPTSLRFPLNTKQIKEE